MRRSAGRSAQQDDNSAQVFWTEWCIAAPMIAPALGKLQSHPKQGQHIARVCPVKERLLAGDVGRTLLTSIITDFVVPGETESVTIL